MLPTGHIEFTWAALNLVQRRAGWFRDADYRLIAVAALAPDLLDKPLALTAYRDTDAALFWGHNLWLHAVAWLIAWGLLALRAGPAGRPGRIRRRFAGVLPYLLAFSGHLVADRIWGFRESLFYPLGAGYWHPWVHVGEPGAMLAAYLHIVRTTPLLVVFEVIGAALLAWFVLDRRLWERARLVRFLRTGRPDDTRPINIPDVSRALTRVAALISAWAQ
jgi:HAMP domain-containing protein